MSKQHESSLCPWPGVQEMIDALPFYVLLVDEDHEIIAANLTTRDHLGVDPAEIVGGFCPKIIHGCDGPFDGCPLEESVASGGFVEREHWDENLKQWYLSSISPTTLRTESGKTVYLHFVRDVTRLKEVSSELSMSHEHHAAVSEILQGIQRCQTSIEVLEVLIEQILSLSWMGLTTSAAGFLVEGDGLRMVVRRNLNRTLEQMCEVVPLGQCLCGKVALSGEIRVCTKVSSDHKIRYKGMQDHGHVIIPLKHGGHVLALLSFYLPPGDALDKRRREFIETVAALAGVAFGRLQMRARLVQTDRMASMGILAAIVGHEIRTPLNALSINLQMLGRGLRAEGALEREALLDKLRQAEAEVQRIDRHLEAPLLALGRHEAADPQPLNLNREVRSSIEFIEPEARRQHVRLTHELAPELPQVTADVVRLRRILLNLLLNGIQSAGKGGEVRLSTLEGDASVQVTVEDDGTHSMELKRGDLEQALNSAPNRVSTGGLGLAVCARLVREMKGQITVESTADKHQRFVVSVPKATPSS